MAILSNINGKFAVESTGAIQFSGQNGSAGYVLKSNGNAAPTWIPQSDIVGAYLPLAGGTLTGATATASGISFTVGGALSGSTATFTGAISAVGASTFTLNDGIFIKAVNGSNNVAATNVWGYGLYEGASKLGEISLVRDGTGNQMYIGTTSANQVLRIGSANKVTALTIDALQNSTFAGNVSMPTGNSTGKFAVMSTSVHGSYDFYNNGTSYFNGAVTVDSTFTQSGGAASNFSGDINQYGGIFRNASFIDVVGNRNSKIELETAYFTHTVSNQAVNIQFPNVAMQGYYKITLSGSYSHQDISGKLTKVIPFGYNPNGGIWRTGNTQSEITIATGGVSTNFTIGNLAWDSTNSKFIVPIYKITSTGNSVKILIEYFGGAANNLKDVNLSSNYTQTAPSPFNFRQYQNIRDRLGIGTTSPDNKLHVYNTIDGFISKFTGGTSSNINIGVFASNSSGFGSIGTQSAHRFNIFTDGTDRMGIKSNGQIDFASPGTPNQSGISMFGGTNGGIMYMYRPVGQNGDIIRFQTAISSNASTRVGYINTTSSATTYNSASDYRLKENVTKITNALDRVSKLKPSRFNFIIEPKNTVDGFIAHEVQKIVPEAVTGVKDEIDENGNNHYQGMDNARLVPLLTAAIQELEARIKILENK